MITVERFPDVKDDSGICDVARVSFNKRASEFTAEKNKGLIKYLVNHGHWSPLGQARLTILSNYPHGFQDIYDYDLQEFFFNAQLAGFKWTDGCSDKGQQFWLNGSIWAFYNNLEYLSVRIQEKFILYLAEHYPAVSEAVGLAKCEDCPVNEDTPDAMVVWKYPDKLIHASFRIKAPVYVARQLVKHQVGLTWNEVSRRYVDTPPEFYDVEKWRQRPAVSIKQGSGQDLPGVEQRSIQRLIRILRKEVVSLYSEFVEGNIAPEQARSILTLDMMTEWIWTGGLTDFARICRERCAPDAQYETRLVANQIDALLEAEFGEKWTNLVSKDGKRVWIGQS